MGRIILHCDLNNFYASVECLYNPEIRNMPVAVCGSQSTRHGIVSAKNYIAKKYGIKTGEAVWEAKNKCPDLVVVRPNYTLYMKFSSLAREIYEQYTDQVEAFGIDENWLDVTASTMLFGTGEKIAHEIKNKIWNELGVTASVGVSYNKIFAKLASDMKKRNAITVLDVSNFKQKAWKLPVEDLLYVGPSTKVKLHKVGIMTIGDLANMPVEFMKGLLGVWGHTLWLFANGFDNSAVGRSSYSSTSIIKGIGNSLTTPRDLISNDEVKILFYVLAESVGERMCHANLMGKTIQITVKDEELTAIQRQAKMPRYTYITTEIAEKAFDIFQKSWDWKKNIRLLGIRAADLVTADTNVQLSFLADEMRRTKRELLDHSVDKIRDRFGHYSVQRALLVKNRVTDANPAEENIINPVSYFR